MHVKLIIASGRSICRGAECKRLPEFVLNDGRIIKGITCASITIYGASGVCTAFYCDDCIEDLMLLLKRELDPNLRAFK